MCDNCVLAECCARYLCSVAFGQLPPYDCPRYKPREVPDEEHCPI